MDGGRTELDEEIEDCVCDFCGCMLSCQYTNCARRLRSDTPSISSISVYSPSLQPNPNEGNCSTIASSPSTVVSAALIEFR